MGESLIQKPLTPLGVKETEVRNIPTGKQTQITARVKEISETIKGEGIDAAIEISDYIKSMGVVRNPNGPDFSRTAEQILKDNRLNGCNEAGVVFASLLRAKGIPTTYIQALNKEAVLNYSSEKPFLIGHVYLEANFGDENEKKLKIINSTTGGVTEDLPDNMLIGAKGLDSWDIGLKVGVGDLQRMFEEKHRELMVKEK